jgi:hypothetical protein
MKTEVKADILTGCEFIVKKADPAKIKKATETQCGSMAKGYRVNGVKARLCDKHFTEFISTLKINPVIERVSD